MIVKVKRQDWSGDFAYAPPLKDAIINTDDIREAFPCESRGSGPWTKVVYRDGKTCIVQGLPDQFLGVRP